MVIDRPSLNLRRQTGFSMIEVLVTIVILAIGMLGLVGLEARLQVAQLEAYQRSQALILLKGMESRVASNQLNAANYVTGTGNAIGLNASCATNPMTVQQSDAIAWCNDILGAGEIQGGAKTGAVVKGLGCIEGIGNNQYVITIAWQGLTAVGSPPGSQCGQGQYNNVVGCASDVCRRTVSTTVQIANLDTP